MLSTVSELVGLISARSGMNRRFETVNHHHGGTCAEHFKQGKQKKKKKRFSYRRDQSLHSPFESWCNEDSYDEYSLCTHLRRHD